MTCCIEAFSKLIYYEFAPSNPDRNQLIRNRFREEPAGPRQDPIWIQHVGNPECYSVMLFCYYSDTQWILKWIELVVTQGESN